MKFLEWMGIEAGELTLAALKREIDWTWPLLIAAFVFGLGVI